MRRPYFLKSRRDHDQFGSHDLERKRVTDTKGTRADKEEASGHRSNSMIDIYDLSLPKVVTPGDV